ncbi:transposase [Streptomyces roseifaciens]|uniref:transposase n=1 Tax=Streptomyces roseifaciens TaxID=1488406 RepID=UPI000717ED48|nr:transposase [Streptomyces roseifaciens]
MTKRLTAAVSHSMLLRLARALPDDPEPVTPRVLGVDEFALRGGRGYRGGSTIVRQYVRRLREAFPRDQAPRKQPSERDVTSWITATPGSLSTDQAQQLKDILARCPELDRAAGHVRAFAELMNNRQVHQVHSWIARFQADDLPALHTFAAGLGPDFDAVVAGLSMHYSSGPVEGHNNKTEMLKRQIFGRVNFDLLRSGSA